MLRVSVSADDLIGRASTAVIQELLKRPGAFVDTYRTRVRPDEPYCHEAWELVDGRTIERDCLPHTLSDEPASMQIFRRQGLVSQYSIYLK